MKNITTVAGIGTPTGKVPPAGQEPKKDLTEKKSNGPALRYVGALPAAGNHNFEEEFLLGENKIIYRQYENNCYRETTEFRTDGQDYNYYYLEYYEYDTTPDEYDVYIDPNDANKLIIDLHKKEDTSFNSKTELQWKPKYGNPELVSTKTRTVKVKGNDKFIVDAIATTDGH